jgi:hypothetical protein
VHANCQKLLPQITQTVALVCNVFPQEHNVIVGIARWGKFFPELQEKTYCLEGSENARFVLGYELIPDAAPTNLPRD